MCTISRICPNVHLYLVPVFAIVSRTAVCDFWNFTCAACRVLPVLVGAQYRKKSAPQVAHHPLRISHQSPRSTAVSSVKNASKELGFSVMNLNRASEGLREGQNCSVRGAPVLVHMTSPILVLIDERIERSSIGRAGKCRCIRGTTDDFPPLPTHLRNNR
jgi:hypothetical protein